MRRKLLFFFLAVALVLNLGLRTQAQTEEEKTQFFPILTDRTGPFSAGGSGFSSGLEDFMELRNMQGGVNGIKYSWEECETAYDTARGLECYERLKKKAVMVHPLSTEITYALIPRSNEENIVIHSMGYGLADASDGRVFPWVFTTPINYSSQNSAKIRFIAKRIGGMDKLKGLKIANLHINTPYGHETKPMLDALAKQYGFKVRHFPVPYPGIMQKAQWMDIVHHYKADWVINRNWGAACAVPLKEAASLDFPRDRIVGVWWCGAEEDVLPAGPAAEGYITANWHGVGQDFPLIQEIVDEVYGSMKGHSDISRVGSVYWNRGIYAGVITEEAIRVAHEKFGAKVLTGEEFRWGMENTHITEERIKELGLEGFMGPVKTSCANHEGGKTVLFQQWDGEKWVKIDELEPMQDFVRQMIEASAAEYAKEKGISPRECN